MAATKFSNDKLRKMLSDSLNQEHTFVYGDTTGVMGYVGIMDSGKLTVIADNVVRERAKVIAYLLNHAHKLSDIAEAFVDVMDGVKEHEINGMTGLPEPRCKEIYQLACELLLIKPQPKEKAHGEEG